MCKRGPMGCVVFPGAIPDALEDGRQGSGLPGRGLQRARRRRRLHVRLPARLAQGRAARDLLRLCQCLRRLRGVAPALLAGDPDLARNCSIFSKHGSPHRALRHDEELNHVHWATTRRPQAEHADGLRHRPSRAVRGDGATTSARRASASRPSRRWRSRPPRAVADGRPGFGMLIDGTYGREALFRAADQPFWIGRPVEEPGSRPLDFEGGGDHRRAAGRMAGRPYRSSACASIIPDDPGRAEGAPGARAAAHPDAARRDRPRAAGRDHRRQARARWSRHRRDRRWSASTRSASSPTGGSSSRRPIAAAWRAIAAVIRANDPLLPRHRAARPRGARGGARERRSRAAAREPLVKGFAVGRTIFADAARRWLAGRDRPTRPRSPTWRRASSASSRPGSGHAPCQGGLRRERDAS